MRPYLRKGLSLVTSLAMVTTMCTGFTSVSWADEAPSNSSKQSQETSAGGGDNAAGQQEGSSVKDADEGTSSAKDVEAKDTWSGSGTEADPYLIKTAADMELLSTNVNSGTTYNGIYFKLASDIDLSASSSFAPIGNSDSPFKGVFDGDGKTVTVNIATTDGTTGLFGRISSATVKNVTVAGDVTSYNSAAGVVGWSVSSTIKNCTNLAVVTISQLPSTGNNGAAGIVGVSMGSGNVIESCLNKGTVKSIATSDSGISCIGFGGILGYTTSYSTDSVAITSCVNKGDVVNAPSYAGVGGIVGKNYCTATIESCSNDGDVSATGNTSTASNGTGGIVGTAYATTTISQCSNTGAVTGRNINKANAGGIVGYSNSPKSEFSECYNTGDVNTYEDFGGCIGGIVGYSYSSSPISACYNAGKVTNNATTSSYSVYACTGGILGYTSSSVAVKNCYSNGTITGLDAHSSYAGTGGIAGRVSSSTSSITGNTYLKGAAQTGIGTAGSSEKADADGFTASADAAEILSTVGTSSYKKDLDEPVNNGYPILRWQDPNSTYAVSFTVADKEVSVTKLNDATITLLDSNGAEQKAEDGKYELASGEYSYTVTRDGYETVKDSFTLGKASRGISVEMTSVKHDYTLTVWPSNTAITLTNADAPKSTTTLPTPTVDEASDKATYTLSLADEKAYGSYELSARLYNYVDQNATLTATGKGDATDITMVAAEKHKLSVTVGPDDAVKTGTKVIVTNTDWNKKTSQVVAEDGSCSMDLIAGSYTYKVKASGYKTATGSFTMGDEDLTLDAVTLESKAAWDGESIDVDWYADNADADTFYISEPEELAGLAALVNGAAEGYDKITFEGKTIYLTKDIDLGSKNWISIGAKTVDSKQYNGTFKGAFNGNSHSINNLTINVAGNPGGSNGCRGLFGQTNGSTISNVTLENVAVITSATTNYQYVGAVIGQGTNTSLFNVVVNSGEVTMPSGAAYIGGLAGSLTGSMSNCSNHAAVTGGYSVGGLAGTSYYGAATSFYHCSNYGAVAANSSSTTSGYAAGGIIGRLYNANDSIKQCVNYGAISGLVGEIGGIAGTNYNSRAQIISDCYNLGTVAHSGTMAAKTGGIIGDLLAGSSYSNSYTSVIRCYNAAEVSDETSSSSNYLGGVIGYMADSSIKSDVINTNYYLSGVAALGIGNKSATDLVVSFGADAVSGLDGSLGECYGPYVEGLAGCDANKLEKGGYPILRWQNPGSKYAAMFTFAYDDDSNQGSELPTITIASKDSGEQVYSGTNAKTDLANGTYTYVVTYKGYDTKTGEFTVNSDTVEITVEMTAVKYQSSIKVGRGFTLTLTKADPLDDDDITIDNPEAEQIDEGEGSTVEKDKYTFDLTNGTYTYTAKKLGYETQTGTFTVDYAGADADVAIEPLAVQTVKCDITPASGTFNDGDPSVSIVTKGGDFPGTLVWPSENASESQNLANGVAFPVGTYTYTITARGFRTVYGEFTLEEGKDYTIKHELEVKTGWGGDINTTWYTNDTTKTEYTLNSEEELAGLAQLVNDGNTFAGVTIKLGCDMNLDDTPWTSIGCYASSGAKTFAGTFDGQGHSITMKNGQMESNAGTFGLFGYLTGATVQNVTMQGSVDIAYKEESTSVTYVGAYAGALAGYASNSTLINCSNQMVMQADVSHEAGNVGVNFGGLVGWSIGTSLESCSNLGSVNVKVSCGGNVALTYVGGLVGYQNASNSACSITNCYNTGAVTATASAAKGTPTAYAGGFIGNLNGSKLTLSNCYSTSATKATAGDASGKTDPIAVISSGSSTFSNNYYLESLDSSAVSSCTKKTETEMKSADFVTSLNNGGSAYIANPNGGYPILSWEKGVTSIAVTTQPEKTEYNDLEDFDDTGMKITAYSGSEDTTGEVVNSGWTITDGKSLAAGKKTVTVEYKGATTTLSITVNAVDHQITSDDLSFSIDAPAAEETGASSIALNKSQASKIKSAKIEWYENGEAFSDEFAEGNFYRAHVTLTSKYEEGVLQWVFAKGATPTVDSAYEILNYKQSQGVDGKYTVTEFDVTYALTGYEDVISSKLLHSYYLGDTGTGAAYGDLADNLIQLKVDNDTSVYSVEELEVAVLTGNLSTCTRSYDGVNYVGVDVFSALSYLGFDMNASDDTKITFGNGNLAGNVELTFGDLRKRSSSDSAIFAFANASEQMPLGSGNGPIMLICGDTVRTCLTGITIDEVATAKTQELTFNVTASDSSLGVTPKIELRDGYGNKIAFKSGATSKAVRDGDTYSYSVSANGYTTVSGTVKVDGTDASVDVTLDPVWDGKTTTEPKQDSDGTYLIGTAEELMWWHDKYEEDNDLNLYQSKVKLTSDIALNADENGTNTWSVLGVNSGYGSGSYAFNGTFDGNGHVIRNILIQRENTYELVMTWTGDPVAYVDRVSEVGLFGYTSGSANIKNLGVEGSIDIFDRPDSSLADWLQVGGIVGLAQGDTTITGCYTNMAIKAVASTETDTVGGYPVAGYGYVTDTYIGGIAGSLSSSATISDCYTMGTYIGAETRQVSIGGITGAQRYNTNTVSNCYSTAAIESHPLSTTTWDSYLGGIVGYNYNNSAASLSNCYALNTNITGGGVKTTAGKVIGRAAEGALSNNYALDSMTISGADKYAETGAGTVNGQDITQADSQNASSYSTWSTSTWQFPAGSQPMLAWQKAAAGQAKTTTYSGQNYGDADDDDWDGYFGSQAAPPYFKVYAKVGSKTVLLKKFTRQEMQDMAASDNEGTLYYSSLSYSGYAGRAVKEYVYVDTLLKEAGVEWKSGDAIVMGTYRYDLSALTADRYYYPDWTSGSSEGAVKVKPVIALKSNGAKSGMSKELFSMYAQQADCLYAYMLTFGQSSPDNYTYNYFMYQQTEMDVDFKAAELASATLTNYLTSAITSASNDLNAAAVTDDPSSVEGDEYYVDQAAHDTFNQAIEAAQAALGNTQATNDDIMNAITDLNAAQTVFDKAKKQGEGLNWSAFTSLYDKATTLYEDIDAVSVDGSDVNESKIWATADSISKLRAAADAAYDVSEDANSQFEIDQAVKQLQAAVDSFKYEYGYREPLERKAMTKQLKKYVSDIDTSKLTVDKQDQLALQVEATLAAIAAAENVDTIDAAYDEGVKAIENIIKPASGTDGGSGDKTDVPKAKTEAKQALQDLADKSGLTGSDKDALQKIVDEYAAKVDAATTADEVADALNNGKAAIKDKINELKLATAKTSAKEQIEEYAAQKGAGYADQDTLNKLVESLKALIDSASNSSAIDSVVTSGKTAIDALVASGSGDEGNDLAEAKQNAINELNDVMDKSGLAEDDKAGLREVMIDYLTLVMSATTVEEVDQTLVKGIDAMNGFIEYVSTGTTTVEMEDACYKLYYKSAKAKLIKLSAAGKKASKIKVPSTVTFAGMDYRVTSIGTKACSKQTSAKKISIGKNVTTIGKNAFASCKAVKSVTLGKAVKSIKGKAFSGCKKLKTVTICSKKLTKASVKNLVKSSKIKTIKVKIGSKKVNKAYANKYAKYAKAYKKDVAVK